MRTFEDEKRLELRLESVEEFKQVIDKCKLKFFPVEKFGGVVMLNGKPACNYDYAEFTAQTECVVLFYVSSDRTKRLRDVIAKCYDIEGKGGTI